MMRGDRASLDDRVSLIDNAYPILARMLQQLAGTRARPSQKLLHEQAAIAGYELSAPPMI